MEWDDGSTCRSEGECLGWVLVVEDDLLLRRTLVRLLGSWGYRFVEAGDGATALDRFHAKKDCIGLVLLDIMLPLLDGVQVARAIRSEEPGLPIVACSAALDEPTVAMLQDLGVDQILHKPFTAQGLLETMGRVLQPR